MRAALGLAADEGIARTTTARIAANAGVSEGSIYRYFTTKDQLLIHVYRQIKHQAFTLVSAGYDPRASIAERFAHLWRQSYLAYGEEGTRVLYAQRFAESELAKAEGGLAHKPMAGLLADLRKDGMNAGQVKNLPLDLLSALFYAPIIAILRSQINGRLWTDQEINAAISASFDSWQSTPSLPSTQKE